ncbi:tetratricopeptide repeat protein [Stieleria neptunia]|uniref:Tetratricopeptide repeat protein n=1 Tax=Stieleria neptunia TaxID=2527979 RepID=A0A518HN88_9BACT|nr:tetratricopeptide repeat protein [Stieleria neptunia]QDV42312.1 tetratricopeptide repeat protein [Stieleria neptunia]
MNRTINGKLLLILSSISVVCIGALYGINALQSGRTARLFLEEGRSAFEEEDYERALRSYRSHLKLDADSIDGRSEFGDLLYKIGEFSGALSEFEHLLRLDAEDNVSRRMAAECSIRVGRFSDARDHLEHLLADQSDAELHDWMAQCQVFAREFSEAKDSLRQAIEQSPDRIESYTRLAILHREAFDAPEAASATVLEMTDANPNSTEAFFARSQFVFSDAVRAGKSGDAESAKQLFSESIDHATRAIQISPDNLEAHLLIVRAASTLDDHDLARKHAESAIQINPSAPTPFLLLAEIASRQDRIDLAIEELSRGIEAVSPDNPRRANLIAGLATIYLESERDDDAEQTIAILESSQLDPAMAKYLRGRLDLRQEKWDQAINQLESVRLAFVERPEMMRAVDFFLGEAYRNKGSFGQAITAYQSSITLDPTWAPPQLALVGVLEYTGKYDEAFQQLQKLVKSNNAPDEGLLALAQRSVQRNLRLPPHERDWSVTAEIIDQAEQRFPDRPEVAILRAEVLGARGETGKAAELLSRSIDDGGSEASEDQRPIYFARLNLALGENDFNRAQQLLDEASQRLGKLPDITVAQASLFILRDGENAIPLVRQLIKESTDFSDEDQFAIRHSIGQLAASNGLSDFAKEVADHLQASHPQDARTWSLSIALSLLTHEESSLADELDRLKAITGESAYWHFGQANLAWLRSDNEGTENRDKAIAHLNQAKRLRPNWSPPYLLESQFFAAAGDDDNALEALLKAIELGERSPKIIRNATSLLFEKKQFAKADELLRLLDLNEFSTIQGLGRTASYISAGQNDLVRGIELARIAAKSSDQFEDHLWHGQLASKLYSQSRQNGQNDQAALFLDEAKSAFERATEISPQSPGTWIQRIRFLVDQKQEQDLIQIVSDATSSIRPEENEFAKAQILAILGKTKEAALTFERALDRGPIDEEKLRTAIAFYFRHQASALAQKRLEQLMSIDPLSADAQSWCNRHLAMLSILRATQGDVLQALALANKNLTDSPNSVADLRVKAAATAMLSGADSIGKAIEIWESISRHPDARPDDHYQLARLYRRTSQWEKASDQLRQAIAGMAGQEDASRYIAEYVTWLMERDELASADQWLSRLEETGQSQEMTLPLKAQLFTRQGKHPQALKLVNHFVGGDAERGIDRLRNAASLAQSLSRLVDPSDLPQYQKLEVELLQQASDRDSRYRFLLVQAMASHDKTDEAIELVLRDDFLKEDLAFAIPVIDHLLNSGKLSTEQIDRLGTVVQDMEQQFGESLHTLGLSASLEKAKGEMQKAETIYRSIIRQDEGNVVALNNLAVLLSEESRTLDEAAELSDKTIEIAGRNPALLDTRAVIAIASGEGAKAIDLLAEALQQHHDPPAIFSFHQAVAYLKAGNTEAAIRCFKKALQDQLDTTRLGKQEQSWYAKLREFS